MVDYCLDQLFIHLDDPQPVIQEAVYPVILRVAEAIDREAVIKKAQAQRMAHRSPTLCDRILAELK